MRIFDKFAQFILRSRANAIVTAAVLVLAPLFRLFAWAILGLVTLRKGIVEGGVVLAGMLFVLIGMTVGASHYAPQIQADPGMSLMVTLNFVGLCLSSIYVWILAIVLRQYASWTKVLQVSLWSSAFIIVALHLVYPDIATWWKPIVKDGLSQMQKQLKDVQLPSSELFVMKAASIMSGVQMLMAMLASLFSLLIARWWQASLYNPGGLGQELLQIRLGLAEAGLLGVTVLLVFTNISTTGQSIMMDVIPVVGIIFALAGVALVHRFIVVMKKPWLGVVIFYGLFLVVGLHYMVFLLISLAFIDSMVNVSGRLIKR